MKILINEGELRGSEFVPGVSTARAKGRKAVEQGMNEEEKRSECDGESLHLRKEEMAEQRRSGMDAN